MTAQTGKHTPGPWTISDSSAVAGPHQIDGPAGEVIGGKIQNRDDAVLIAAAPELLAACEMAAAELATPVNAHSREMARQRIEAAIAKATAA